MSHRKWHDWNFNVWYWRRLIDASDSELTVPWENNWFEFFLFFFYFSIDRFHSAVTLKFTMTEMVCPKMCIIIHLFMFEAQLWSDHNEGILLDCVWMYYKIIFNRFQIPHSSEAINMQYGRCTCHIVHKTMFVLNATQPSSARGSFTTDWKDDRVAIIVLLISS